MSTDHLEKMDVQLNKLSMIINDLLDVTKIQSGKWQFTERLFDFDGLVRETVESMLRTSVRHKIIVRGEIKRKVYGDRYRTGQVLTNLLSNAIKYSPNAKKIEIYLTRDAEHMTCRVKDYGVGISKVMQTRIFERFFQVANNKQQKYPGLGLGLYISSEIVKRQNGTIWVESERGKGSTFSFSLPLRRKISPAAQL
jgi:signal transduction histidine kinase